MLHKWKHIVCILQPASCFIYFHHHGVPLYKYTAVYLCILLLVDSLVVSSIMRNAPWNILMHVSWCPRAGASPRIYTAVEFLRHRLYTHSTFPRKVKIFQSEYTKLCSHSADEHSCCFAISPTFGAVQRFNSCRWVWNSLSLELQFVTPWLSVSWSPSCLQICTTRLWEKTQGHLALMRESLGPPR